MIFPSTDFNEKKFFSLIKENLTILDYGCGLGVWDKDKIYDKQIFLYDKNKLLMKLIKKKYISNKNIRIFNNKFNQEVCLINSTIQYMSDKELVSLSKRISNHKKIIISDIPKYPRVIELFLLFFFLQKQFLTKILFPFNKDYLKVRFYLRKKYEIINFFPNHKSRVIVNLNNESTKNGRYTLVFSKK